MGDKYILDDDGNPVKEPNLITWARWFEENQDKKRVAQDTVGPARVSPVFLGLDHRWGEGPPLIFETMVFGGNHDEDGDRYSTKAEALEGHARFVERERKELQ